jgi:hypothetical protein
MLLRIQSVKFVVKSYELARRKDDTAKLALPDIHKHTSINNQNHIRLAQNKKQILTVYKNVIK